MRILINLSINYTAIVFGFQHYAWFTNKLLRPILPDIELHHLEVGGFVVMAFVFLVFAQAVKERIFQEDDETSLSETFSGRLINLFLFLLLAWFWVMVGLNLYTHFGPSNLTKLITTFQESQLQGGLSMLLRTEPIFNALIRVWLVSESNLLGLS